MGSLIAWVKNLLTEPDTVPYEFGEDMRQFDEPDSPEMWHEQYDGPVDEPDTISYEAELDLLTEVNAHLDDGKKVCAIKAYREATGVGIKEAKAAVDAMCLERNGTARP